MRAGLRRRAWGHRGPDHLLERVRRAARLRGCRWRGVLAFQAGVEQLVRVRNGGASHEGELDDLLVGLSGADDAVVRPDRELPETTPSPTSTPPLDLRVGVVDEPADPGVRPRPANPRAPRSSSRDVLGSRSRPPVIRDGRRTPRPASDRSRSPELAPTEPRPGTDGDTTGARHARPVTSARDVLACPHACCASSPSPARRSSLWSPSSRSPPDSCCTRSVQETPGTRCGGRRSRCSPPSSRSRSVRTVVVDHHLGVDTIALRRDGRGAGARRGARRRGHRR